MGTNIFYKFSEFEQYSVETLTNSNTFNFIEFWEREIRQDAWLSSAKGFDAWSVIWSVRGKLFHPLRSIG